MSNAIALKETRTPSLFPSESEWAMLKDQAALAVKSKLLPAAVDTPEKAITIALKGRELGIPPMHAFSHIHIVQGKPTISAELMLSLIYKNCPGAVVNYIENTPKRCVIEVKRPGGKPTPFTYTIEEAQAAGLMSKDSWRKYPAAMLRARAVSIAARAVFPDAIMGCSYIPEELGADVNDEGQVIAIPVARNEPTNPGPGRIVPEQPTAADGDIEPACFKYQSKWPGKTPEEVYMDPKNGKPAMVSYINFLTKKKALSGLSPASQEALDETERFLAFIDNSFDPDAQKDHTAKSDGTEPGWDG